MIWIFCLDCWDGEPENRPSMCKVVERLKIIINEHCHQNNQDQTLDGINDRISNEPMVSKSDNGELSQFDKEIIESSNGKNSSLNFDQVDTKEIIKPLIVSNELITEQRGRLLKISVDLVVAEAKKSGSRPVSASYNQMNVICTETKSNDLFERRTIKSSSPLRRVRSYDGIP